MIPLLALTHTLSQTHTQQKVSKRGRDPFLWGPSAEQRSEWGKQGKECAVSTTALQHHHHSRLAVLEKGETWEAVLCRVSGLEGAGMEGRMVKMEGGGAEERKRGKGRDRESWRKSERESGGHWKEKKRAEWGISENRGTWLWCRVSRSDFCPFWIRFLLQSSSSKATERGGWIKRETFVFFFHLVVIKKKKLRPHIPSVEKSFLSPSFFQLKEINKGWFIDFTLVLGFKPFRLRFSKSKQLEYIMEKVSYCTPLCPYSFLQPGCGWERIAHIDSEKEGLIMFNIG